MLVVGATEHGVTVLSEGRPKELPLNKAKRFNVYERDAIEVSAGERIRIGRNRRQQQLKDNRGLSSNKDQKNGVLVEETAQFYENLPEIYADSDSWHQLTHAWIRRHVDTNCANSRRVLNLGSGGESYGISEEQMLHVDVASTRFSPEQNHIIADVQNLPSEIGRFDTCLCVGSVVNYCDAALLINNIRDTLSPGGKVLIEFESSHSLDLIGTGAFRENAALAPTFYNKKKIQLWAYSENYMRGLLKAAGFTVLKRETFHHLSPLVYLVTKNSNLSAKFQVFDGVLRKCPVLNRYSSNVIFLCEKIC